MHRHQRSFDYLTAMKWDPFPDFLLRDIECCYLRVLQFNPPGELSATHSAMRPDLEVFSKHLFLGKVRPGL